MKNLIISFLLIFGALKVSASDTCASLFSKEEARSSFALNNAFILEKQIQTVFTKYSSLISAYKQLIQLEANQIQMSKTMKELEKKIKNIHSKIEKKNRVDVDLLEQSKSLVTEYLEIKNQIEPLQIINDTVFGVIVEKINSIEYKEDMELVHALHEQIGGIKGAYSVQKRLSEDKLLLKEIIPQQAQSLRFRSDEVLQSFEIPFLGLKSEVSKLFIKFENHTDSLENYTAQFKELAREFKLLELDKFSNTSGNYSRVPKNEYAVIKTTFGGYKLIYIGDSVPLNMKLAPIASLDPSTEFKGVRRGAIFKIKRKNKEQTIAVVGFFKNSDVLVQDMNPSLNKVVLFRMKVDAVAKSKKIDVSPLLRPIIFGDIYYRKGNSYFGNVEAAFERISRISKDTDISDKSYMGVVGVGSVTAMAVTEFSSIILGVPFGSLVAWAGAGVLKGLNILNKNSVPVKSDESLDTNFRFFEIASGPDFLRLNDYSNMSRNEDVLLDIRQLPDSVLTEAGVIKLNIIEGQKKSIDINDTDGRELYGMTSKGSSYSPNLGIDVYGRVIEIHQVTTDNNNPIPFHFE